MRKSYHLKDQLTIVYFSFKDEELASKINSIADKEKLYREIASTAESGWDFSSRWMRLDV